MIKKLFNQSNDRQTLEAIDKDLSLNIDEVISAYSVEDIVRATELLNTNLSCSLFSAGISEYLINEGLMAGVLINSDNFSEYIKLRELASALGIDTCDLTLAIASYQLSTGDLSSAKELYSRVFTQRFDLSRYGYSDSLSAYIDTFAEGACEFLRSLIENGSNQDVPTLDLSNTYLLLLSHMESEDKDYEEYLAQAILTTRSLVDSYRREESPVPLSDTDSERNLCELLTLKLEYFASKGKAPEADIAYRELTDEIALSGCLRYYHARDRIYKEYFKST